jgi:hypothetical protein
VEVRVEVMNHCKKCGRWNRDEVRHCADCLDIHDAIDLITRLEYSLKIQDEANDILTRDNAELRKNKPYVPSDADMLALANLRNFIP